MTNVVFPLDVLFCFFVFQLFSFYYLKKKKKSSPAARDKTQHFGVARAPPSTNTSQTLSDEKAYSDFTLQ